MSVRRAAWLSAGVGLALVLVLGTFLTRESISINAAVNDVRSIYDPAAAQSAILDTALSDMQRGVSGFLIGGQESDLEPYVQGSRRSDLALAQLRELVVTDRQLTDLVILIARDRQQWIERSAEPTIEARRAGDVPKALSIFQNPTSQQLYAAVEANAAILAAILEDRRSEAFDDLTSRAYRLILLVVGTSVLLCLALVVGFLLAHRGVLAPLDRLRSQIRTSTRVDNHAAISLQRPTELQTLAADVEELRRHLVEQIDEAAAARQALEQQAPVVSAFRAELAASAVVAERGLAIHGELKPAEGVLAGDWWDSTRLRATGEVAIVVADISGHGAAAALAAIRLKQAIGFLLRAGHDLPEIAAATAAQFKDETWYATVVAVCIDPTDGSVRYINAGHPAPLLIDDRGKVVGQLERTALPLGVGRDAAVGRARLEPGQSILLFSDGLLESRGEDGEEFGEERLLGLLRTVPDDQRAPRELVRWLLGAARQRATNWGNDDVTLVAIRRG